MLGSIYNGWVEKIELVSWKVRKALGRLLMLSWIHCWEPCFIFGGLSECILLAETRLDPPTAPGASQIGSIAGPSELAIM